MESERVERMSERVDEFTNRPTLRRKRAVALMIQRATIALFIVYCLMTMALLLFMSYQGNDQRNRLVDCTTPSGQCYKEGQQRTAQAIQFLIADNQLTREMIVKAVACAQDPVNDTQAEIKACINKK